jgi:hypothetical protein
MLLEKATIAELADEKRNSESRIEELEGMIQNLKEYVSKVDRELEQKRKTQTHNIVKITKWYSFHGASITISVDAVSDEDETTVIDRYERTIEYADRAIIWTYLEEYAERFHFKKIITNMKLTKAIREKYIVEETA